MASSSGLKCASEATAQAAITAINDHWMSPEWRINACARCSPRSALEAAANTDATANPMGVAMMKPAFGAASNTPGVTSAWRARNPAAARKARETRNTRASPLRRAAAPVP